jgi:cell division protein FtsI/penicillin-binding protein 2
MRIFFVLMTVLLLACTNSTVPSDIIPARKMENILWQLMESDEYVNTQVAKDSLKKSSTERMKIYQQVFDLNGTSMAEFKKSYQYYMSRPDITKIMFDSIAAKATRQRADLYKPKPGAITTKPDTVIRPRPAQLTLKADSLRLKPVKLNIKPASIKSKSHKAKTPLPNKMGKKP